MAAIPLTVKVALVLLAIGAGIFLAGFSTSYWVDYEDPFTYNRHRIRYPGLDKFHFGLWKRCCYKEWSEMDPYIDKDHKYRAGCFSWFSEDGWGPTTVTGKLRATQFFETMALICLVLGVVLLLLGACLESCQPRKILPILSGVACCGAGACAIVGAIIFRSWEQTEDRLNWSFVLAIVGGVLFAVSGVVIVVGVILKK